MKNIILTGIILSCIGSFACKKDNPNSNVITSKKITGMWTLEKYGDERPIGAAEDFTTYSNTTYNFKNDFKLEIIDGSGTYTDEWEVLDEGKMLHFKKDLEVYYIISKLDEHSLVMYYIFTDNGEYNKRSFYFSR